MRRNRDKPRRSLQYRDARGRAQTLTAEQHCYLTTAISRGGRLTAGWGGLGSLLTARLLEERGVVTLTEHPIGSPYPRWEITGVTRLGEQLAERWAADQ